MKVALYARVSSDRQDIDLSISAQLRALRDHAARNGHQVIREFVDEAETGRTTARPALRGPHASRPWVKALKSLTEVSAL